jgi:NAD(P)-dependent dehydrogenase (short-subunit alcohol dehydrogenase family)
MSAIALLVTGASRGIGRARALLAGRNGRAADVNYREDAKAADAVVETIAKSGGRFRAQRQHCRRSRCARHIRRGDQRWAAQRCHRQGRHRRAEREACGDERRADVARVRGQWCSAPTSKLSEENTSYEKVVDRLRHSLALQSIKAPSVSLAQIA